MQPIPYAQRQKLTFDNPAPTLDPKPPREPQFFEPASDPVPSTSSNQRKKPSPTKSHPTPTHGNYLSYYAKRGGSAHDERLALLPKEWFKGKRVLDVGCNAGAVTVELAQRYAPSRVTGVDIESALIRQANSYAELAWSRQAPLKRVQDAERRRERSLPAAPAADSSTYEPHHFPIALPRLFGYLPHAPSDLLTTYIEEPEVETSGIARKGTRKVMRKPPSHALRTQLILRTATEVKLFPDNLCFKFADWVNEEISTDRKGYDVILAFSVTKWIHLNGGNEGLFTFFSRCFKALVPGGRLVLEPQPFSSYAKAARFSDELKATFEKLKNGEGSERGWRYEEGDFERVLLEEIGFGRKEELGETGKNGPAGFRRSVEVYFKKDGSWV